MYMDRTFVKRCRKTPIYDLGLKIFRSTVLLGHGATSTKQQNTQQQQQQQQPRQQRHIHTQGSSGVGPRIRRLLLEAIHRERKGEVIDTALLTHTLEMYVHVRV